MPEFSRKNTFSMFVEYANDSSHIVAGSSRQRKLADFGGAYVRRVARFKGSEIGYIVEVRPVLFESDPVANGVNVTTITSGPQAGTSYTYTSSESVVKCVPFVVTGTITVSQQPGFPGESYIYTSTCGRQWTFGQAFTPIGFKYSMRTRHRLQPFIVGTAGYMYTSRPIPLADAEAFNFTVDVGAGVELYKDSGVKSGRSVSVECRVHHISNRDTAQENPGIDQLTYKVSYNFGK